MDLCAAGRLRGLLQDIYLSLSLADSSKLKGAKAGLP